METRTNTRSLVAVFSSRAAAESAREELLRNGFTSAQVEVDTTDFARDVASGNAGLSGTHRDSSGGGIGGFFRRIFGADDDVTDDDRDYYTRIATRGEAAVIVHASTDDESDRAADLLNAAGAVDVDQQSVSEVTSEESRRLRSDVRHGDSIPVVEENLRVGKRAVQRKGVRIHTSLTERPVEERINLREEHVTVERRPADRPATEADFAAANRDVIEVTETVEEPVVSKQARVVEEVVIGKDVRDRTETVRDTVRRSEVHVDDSAAGTGRNDLRDDNYRIYDEDFRNDFRTRYGTIAGARYEDYEPGYRYGYRYASDPRYQGRRWEDIEMDLRTEYTREYPNSTWERIKDSVRYGWDKVTGRR